MGVLRDLKVFFRSGSWQFVKDLNPPPPTEEDQTLSFLNWCGHQVFYRPGTSDQGIIYEVLLRRASSAEYKTPSDLRPKVIFDIGANIGVVAIWLSEKFPDATIYAFEPMPENFEILKKNTERLQNVKIFNYGLGKDSKEVPVYANNQDANLGGYSIYQRPRNPFDQGTRATPFGKIVIKKITEVLEELEIRNIDLLKVDTEGSEFDIVSTIPIETRAKIQWVMGELHGINNFETLALLNPHIGLEIKKRAVDDVFVFFGRNRESLY